MLRKTLLPLALVVGCLSSPSLALAEGEPGAAPITRFEKAERIEQLRYRHLWIAYGAIWLLVFGFALRTWQRTQATAAELDELKRRLAALEANDG